MPVMVHPEVGKDTSSGEPSGWTITEITNESSMKTTSPKGSAEKQRDLICTIRNRKVFYMVESSEGSPERDRGAITIQTGLSLMMQKMRLKRNCRGIRSTMTVLYIADLNKRNKLQIIYLMETKNTMEICEKV